MSGKVFFFEPIFKEKIWGGGRLKDFGYDIPSDMVGECWGISSHPNGQSVVKNGEYMGKTLGELWEGHRELFGGIIGEKFPILVKIIDANDDLSVQVHPGDEYAEEYENGELGKTECWYILDCQRDAELIYGIKANYREELNEMIDKGQWDSLLQTISIKKGDFLYVPSGTVHALKAGTLILEIQQNSDTTYRLYDYNRRDEQGNLRELHIQKSKDVIEVPFINRQPIPEIVNVDGMTKTKFIESQYFTVEKYEVNGQVNIVNGHPFMLMSVIEGEGLLFIDGEVYPITKGDHFMLSAQANKFSLNGSISIIVSYL
ncbi:MAG: mannose-6-phosphate isomerase, class I [Tissierella sp.]|nr:mannose-6-phosphate isomerase, class I [Tissierella sp.]